MKIDSKFNAEKFQQGWRRGKASLGAYWWDNSRDFILTSSFYYLSSRLSDKTLIILNNRKLDRQSSGLNPKVLFKVFFILLRCQIFIVACWNLFFAFVARLLPVVNAFAKSSTFLSRNDDNFGLLTLVENKLKIIIFVSSIFMEKSNVRPENRFFSFLNPLAWSIWISMVSWKVSEEKRISYLARYLLNKNTFDNFNFVSPSRLLVILSCRLPCM